MKSHVDLHAGIEQYQSKYRREDLPSLVVSGLYDLFSERGSDQQISLRWPDPWQSAVSAGVYIMLDEGLSILYVGKASLRNSLGSRLAGYFGYFQYPHDRRCKILSSNWTTLPRYVVTVGVAYPFEAPALEEYLIGELQPPDNRQGILPIETCVPPHSGD